MHDYCEHCNLFLTYKRRGNCPCCGSIPILKEMPQDNGKDVDRFTIVEDYNTHYMEE
jgi:hypothetical protein